MSDVLNRVQKNFFAVLTIVAIVASFPSFAAAIGPDPDRSDDVIRHSPYVMAYDSLDVEDHGGYSSEYIFGLTKGIMRSTMVPALKPIMLILTVPLDLVFLPFAAIGGFFR